MAAVSGTHVRRAAHLDLRIIQLFCVCQYGLPLSQAARREVHPP